MADEPKKEHPEDIESILTDLDAILTDMGGAELVAPKPAEPPPPKIDIAPLPAPKPVEPPIVELPAFEIPMPKAEAPAPPPPKPAAPPVVEIPAFEIPMPKAAAPVPPPKPAEPPKAASAPSVELPAFEIPAPKAVPPPPAPASADASGIELAPREGLMKSPEKKPEPPKPAAKLPNQNPIELSSVPAPVSAPPPPPPPAPKPEPAPAAAAPVPAPPSPTAPPAPAPALVSGQVGELPADTPKEQIRRVAYIHTASCAEVKASCAAFLSQAARTISKKPLFLREVLTLEVAASSDPNAVLQKALQMKASAVLAIVEDWPPAKIEELSEACARASVLFRAVAPADAQKKSTAVDIIVDMMLLPGEG